MEMLLMGLCVSMFGCAVTAVDEQFCGSLLLSDMVPNLQQQKLNRGLKHPSWMDTLRMGHSIGLGSKRKGQETAAFNSYTVDPIGSGALTVLVGFVR
jgi:hypothetical protein